jgi:hypothetical protein
MRPYCAVAMEVPRRSPREKNPAFNPRAVPECNKSNADVIRERRERRGFANGGKGARARAIERSKCDTSKALNASQQSLGKRKSEGGAGLEEVALPRKWTSLGAAPKAGKIWHGQLEGWPRCG